MTTAKDGTRTTKELGAHGQVKREEVAHKDGSKEITTHQGGRDIHESITIRNNVQIRTVSITRTREFMPERFRHVGFERHYERDRFGNWVYGPRFVVGAPVFTAWFDPYWYDPAGVLIVHPFHFVWGWESYGWYGWCGPYWRPLPVYPTPAVWATDFIVANYLAEHFSAQPSLDDAREEARVAHEEAVKAQQAAAQATTDVEEARTLLAEARQKDQEAAATLARVQSMRSGPGSSNPNCVAMDEATKTQLAVQVNDSITRGSKGIPQALQTSLDDPKHLYVVSKATKVTSADEGNPPAGEISDGDLLLVEPGQTLAPLPALIRMKVLTSKGEDGETTAGTVINVSLKQIQEFDNEFQAKTDEALAAAESNQAAFKKGS